MARDGKKPNHIFPWAPQDYRDSKVRMRSVARQDPMLRLVYLEALFAMMVQGGAISDDPFVLEDELGLPEEEIRRCLPVLTRLAEDGRGGLVAEDGQLTNRRVIEELEARTLVRGKRSAAGQASVESRRERFGTAQPPRNDESSEEDASRTLVPPTPNNSSSSTEQAPNTREQVLNSPEHPVRARGGDHPRENHPPPSLSHSHSQVTAPSSLRSDGSAEADAGGQTSLLAVHATQPKRLTEQQECVELVLQLYAEHGLEAPEPSVIGRWRKHLGTTQKLLDVLHHLSGSGHLTDKGNGYVWAVVQRVARGEPLAAPGGGGSVGHGSRIKPPAYVESEEERLAREQWERESRCGPGIGQGATA